MQRRLFHQTELELHRPQLPFDAFTGGHLHHHFGRHDRDKRFEALGGAVFRHAGLEELRRQLHSDVVDQQDEGDVVPNVDQLKVVGNAQQVDGNLVRAGADVSAFENGRGVDEQPALPFRDDRANAFNLHGVLIGEAVVFTLDGNLLGLGRVTFRISGPAID